MRIVIPPGENIYATMRKVGYHPLGVDLNTGEQIFSRRLGLEKYPHFHVYIAEGKSGKIIINLHLDQKKPVYKGAPAHSGEYRGPVLEKEAARIKKIVGGL